MVRVLCVLVLLIGGLAACARPLTLRERDFAATLYGPSLDAAPVRFHGRNPLYALAVLRDPRPMTTCRERIRPPETAKVETRIAATALWNRVFVARPFFREDFLAGYPSRMTLENAMFAAHELTHVWQWQNRARTGYAPARAAAEHGPGADPYLFTLDPARSFLDHGYEQQAGLVEEFVCCRALDPDGARTERLYRLLQPVFPAIERRSVVPKSHIFNLYVGFPQGSPCP